jgi:transposase-like protein
MDRDRLVTLVEQGLTVREIAGRHEVSVAKIRYWLKRHGLQTVGMRRRAVASAALRAGLTEVVAECPKHGPARMVGRHDGRLRCTACRSEAVSERRRRIKVLLVEEAGGRCATCGYDRCVAALSFHHLDPATKSFTIAGNGVTRSLDRARAEAAKCALLCANCHMEVESGLRELPSAGRVPG